MGLEEPTLDGLAFALGEGMTVVGGSSAAEEAAHAQAVPAAQRALEQMEMLRLRSQRISHSLRPGDPFGEAIYAASTIREALLEAPRDAESAVDASARHDFSSCAKPEPRPPSAKAARRMTG